LVTNVKQFVGLAAANALASQVSVVVCHDKTFADDHKRVEFGEAHSSLWVIPEQHPEEIAAAVIRHFGKIDVLVNNDAFPAIRAPIDSADLADMRAGLEALITTPFALTKAVVPHMKSRRHGKILFVTSAAPLRGLPNYSMYAAARGGANALAVSLSKELAPFNIQVNAVAPNFVESPTYFPPELLADPEALRKITRNIPLGRLAKPEEAGALIAFLASDQADFITGHVMPFAGGWA
jgi:NAD(P)-dependent dehydrogenase (short-subunit alcohol dehydrogenase family)